MQAYTPTSGITNWTVKIHPNDLSKFYNSDDALSNIAYVEAYVSDVKAYNITKYDTPLLTRIMSVYVPSEGVIQQLSQIHNTYFRVSLTVPNIVMIVDKGGLQQIAENPAVYCIRIHPNNPAVLL
jgi:hypothetical protein